MILDESLFDEAMYTNISSNPYDLNIMKSKLDDENGRDWKYIKSFKFKDDAIERANRMIASGEAYVAQVYSWKNEDHGEIYFRKADDGTVIDKSVQHVDCDIHGPEIKTVSDKTIIKPVREAKEEKCVICKKTITGYGNNAEPVAKGRCCDICNASKVIPARIAQLYGLKNKNINEDLSSSNYIDLFKIKSDYTEQFIKDLEQGSYTEDVFENAKEAYDVDDLQVTVIINNDNTVKYPFIYGSGYDKRCLIFTNLHDYANEIDQDYEDMLNQLSEITGVSKEILIGDYIEEDEEDLYEDINNNRIAELEDALEAMEARHDPSEREDIEELKAEIEKLKAERDSKVTNGFEKAGKDALGCDLYKYGKYSIVHFPIDFEIDGTSHHVESYIIQSPFVLDNDSNYRLPLRAENEAGEEITFKTLEEAKAWIDKYDGKYKLEFKYGDEIHAVIKDEFINESLTENNNTYNSARLHVTTNANYSYYFNFKSPITEEQINEFKQKVKSGKAYWLDIKKEFDCEEVKSAKELIKPTAIIKSRDDKDDLKEDVEIVSLTNEQANENNGLSTILNMLIKDEFDAIQGYNDAIVNFETEGRGDLVQVLKDIVNEENLHVGQLEVLLEQVNGAANSIDQGKAEAETQLTSTQVFESLNKKDLNTYSKELVNAYTDEEIQKLLQEIRTYGRQDLYNKAMDLKRNGSNTSWKYVAKEISNIIYNEVNEDPEEGMHY